MKPGYVPLERAISKLGIASRAKARQFILAGIVRVNGTIRIDPLFPVVPEHAAIEDSGDALQAHELVLRKASEKESHLTIRLTEGKNREIRRMFAAIGHEVTRLKRVGYGGLELGALQPGEYRELADDDFDILA